MKYFDLSTVVNAYINFQNTMTNKSWGYLALIRGCKSEIRSCVPFEVDLDSVSNFLETIFNLSSIKKTYNSTKSWYVVFSNQWSDYFSTQGKNIANIYDIAIWSYRRKAFDDNVTVEDILSQFINEFNLPVEVINSKFLINSNGISFSNTIYDENALKNELSKQGVNVSTENIDAKKSSVVASPGELSRGPFIQTLYAGLEISDYILIMQSNYFNLYSSDCQNNNSLFSVKFPLQTIYYGAPGTGKSFKVKSEKLAGVPEDNIFRTTFHPDYDYANFVGCYKPTKAKTPLLEYSQLINVFETISEPHKLCKIGFQYWKSFDKINKTQFLKDCGKETQSPELNAGIVMGKNYQQNNSPITYSFVPQVFTKAYVKAWNNPEQAVYLVIEEINRGNCAQIFGDIFQLLDRNNAGYSEYPIDIDEDLKNYLIQELGEDNDGIKDGKLCLPPNLNLLATMNTSDQSLFPMDSAFKRRWDWEYVPIRSKGKATETDTFQNFTITIGSKEHDNEKTYLWTDFLEKVNEKILDVTDSEDKQMGEYFIKKNVDQTTFINKVMYYLWSEVCKDNYKTNMNLFFTDDGTEFSFNELFKENATKLLVGFMEKLKKDAEAAAE